MAFNAASSASDGCCSSSGTPMSSTDSFDFSTAAASISCYSSSPSSSRRARISVSETSLMSSPVYRKESLRQTVWARMRRNGSLLSVDADSTRRIPAFVGSQFAARNVSELAEFKAADVVAVGPSMAETSLRRLALQAGKTLLVPVISPGSDAFGFLLNGRGMSATRVKMASNVSGLERFGTRLKAGELLGWGSAHVDVFCIGSVAVAQNGMRIGAGRGHGELEWAVLSSAAWVDPSTLVVTMAHRDQVVHSRLDLPLELKRHCDLPADVVATPGRVFRARRAIPRPIGVDWSLIDSKELAENKILSALYNLERSQSDAYFNDYPPTELLLQEMQI